jgi:site-specific DNA recombinase
MPENKIKVSRILKPSVKAECADNKKKRVAAYCRVSTKSDGQETSYDTQVAVYTQKIKDEPGWEMAGIYADFGMSGTQAQRRPKFLKMIADCEDGKIDIILCKSLSRFSRNTLDAVQYIRRLKELGVRMIFEKEGIDTESEISEMLITVLAAFAQEESRSVSENVKWGKRKRLQNGIGILAPTYGYQRNEEGTNYEIVPEEAEVVRRIFDMYEKGVSVPKIVDVLLRDGVKPPRFEGSGSEKWDESRIHYMIQNEKYIGTLTCQRFYTADHLTHRSFRNAGILPSQQLENHHEAIIGHKQFERCNEILRLRKKNNHSFYPYGNFLICPYCGTILYQRRLNIQEASHSSLVCEGEGACRDFAILAPFVRKAVLDAWNTLDVDEVERIAGLKQKKRAEEAKKLLAGKDEHPTFEAVEYWWLDEYVDSITFGQHSVTASDLKVMDPETAQERDDRTISIKWKCGLVTTLPSGVKRDSQHPRHVAELWDGFLLRYPERYPQLTEEVRKKRGLSG